MPVRWSALKVKEATDRVEEIVNPILAPLGEAKKVVAEARKIPNLPEYIGQRLSRLEGEIERVTGGIGQDYVRDSEGKGSYHEVHRKGYIHRAIEDILKDLPKGDLAKEQASFQKWLDLFGGDKEKALAGMSLSRPEAKPKETPQLALLVPAPSVQIGYNPVREAIEFFTPTPSDEQGLDEPAGIHAEPSKPLPVASEEFAENEDLQIQVGDYIDELCERTNERYTIQCAVAQKFNLVNDIDLREWIEEYLDHYETHEGVEDVVL